MIHDYLKRFFNKHFSWVGKVGLVIATMLGAIAALVTSGLLKPWEYENNHWTQKQRVWVVGLWCTDAYTPHYPQARISFKYDDGKMLFSQLGFGSSVDHKPTPIVLVNRDDKTYFRYPESTTSLTSISGHEDTLFRERWKATPDGRWVPASSDGSDMYERC